MNPPRIAICLFALLVAGSLVWTYYVYATPQNWDELFHVKTSLVSPSDFSTGVKLRYAIDHPSIKRHVYRWVLRAMGIHEMNVPDVDYTKGKEWNFDHGRIPPMEVSVALRFVNVVFMLGAITLIFLAALSILRNAYLALLTAIALVLSNRVAQGVVAYLGCDAILAFFIALSLFLWIVLAQRGKASGVLGAILVGGAAGLALSSKFNGGLVIIAYCIYLAIANTGYRRVVMPLLAAAVCAVVFISLNPVMWGGPTWTPAGAVRGMLHHREIIWQSQYAERPMPRLWLITVFFPYAAFIPALVAAAVWLRHEKWVLPVCVWGTVLIIGTLLTVNRTYARYYLPVDMAAFTAAGLLGWRLIQNARSSRAAVRIVQHAGRARMILAAAAAALVMLTVVVAYEPFGPFRMRSERSILNKVLLFYRQAGAYYGLVRPLDAATVREEVTGHTTVDMKGARAERERPGIGTVWLLSGAAFVAACALVFVLGCRVVGWWRALAVLLVLLWTEFAKGAYYVQPPEDKYFCLFAVALLFAWIDLYGRGGPVSLREAAALGAACGLCAAAAGFGIVMTGLTVLVVLFGRGASVLVTACMLLAAAVLFVVTEPTLCYLGARGPVAFVRAGLLGSVKLWTAKGADSGMFLMPVEYYFPWLALLPVGASVLFAARKEAWTMPVALWSAAIIATTVATQPAVSYYPAADVNFALALGCGLPALALLRETCATGSSSVNWLRDAFPKDH